MKLDAWLQQDHSLDERLRVIECLCQAVNEVHDQGEALGGLEPGRIEVVPGRRCDLAAAGNASPSPAYTAPDGARGPTAAGDVYAAGVIAWEILAGRSAGRSPRHLNEVRPDLPSELADAVMACLERSPEWRPKDLTYLAQMAAARQTGTRRPPESPRATLPPRPAPPRMSGRRPSRRTWPLLAALVVLLGIAAWQWSDYLGVGRASVERSAPPPTAPPAATPAPPAPLSTTTAATEEVTTTAPAVAVPDTAPPPPSPPEERPAARPEAAPVNRPAPAPLAQPAAPPASIAPPVPAPPARAAAPERIPAPEPTAPMAIGSRDTPSETTGADPSPLPSSDVQAEPPAPAPPAEPAVLASVSPAEVQRPGKVLLDLRGRGFLPRHQVRVLPVEKVPWGIKVASQKHVSDTLITVLLELSEEVEPGDYAFAVEDGLGTRSDPVVFQVTK